MRSAAALLAWPIKFQRSRRHEDAIEWIRRVKRASPNGRFGAKALEQDSRVRWDHLTRESCSQFEWVEPDRLRSLRSEPIRLYRAGCGKHRLAARFSCP